MAVEPPTPDYNHLAAFTHREMRPYHEPHPSPKGISYGESTLIDPRKMGKFLIKIAGKGKGSKTKITHGKK